MKQCTAHVTSGPEAGRRCKLPPVRGSNVCHKHGASAGQVRRAAAVRVAEADAMRVYERWSANGDRPGPVDVVSELHRLVAEVTAFKRWCSDRLAAVEAGFDPADPAVAATVAMFERSMDRAGRVLADVARLGLEARATSVAERDGRVLVAVIEGALRDLGHNPAAANVRAAVYSRIRQHAPRVDGD